MNINYENAKAINRIYRQETRMDKKKSRFRFRRDEDRDAAIKQKIAFQESIKEAKNKKAVAIESEEEPPKEHPMTRAERAARRATNNSLIQTVNAENASQKTNEMLHATFKLKLKRKQMLDPIKYNKNFFKILQDDPIKKTKVDFWNSY